MYLFKILLVLTSSLRIFLYLFALCIWLFNWFYSDSWKTWAEYKSSGHNSYCECRQCDKAAQSLTLRQLTEMFLHHWAFDSGTHQRNRIVLILSFLVSLLWKGNQSSRLVRTAASAWLYYSTVHITNFFLRYMRPSFYLTKEVQPTVARVIPAQSGRVQASSERW